MVSEVTVCRCSTPSHYPNHWWLIVNSNQRMNFREFRMKTVYKMHFENGNPHLHIEKRRCAPDGVSLCCPMSNSPVYKNHLTSWSNVLPRYPKTGWFITSYNLLCDVLCNWLQGKLRVKASIEDFIPHTDLCIRRVIPQHAMSCHL